MCYWRTRSQMEVDFVVGSQLAIEVKAKAKVIDRDIKHLLTLGKANPKMKLILLCLEKSRRELNGVSIIPVTDFLNSLWIGEFSHLLVPDG
jgi:predicted AAA+ superfamily ATPase